MALPVAPIDSHCREKTRRLENSSAFPVPPNRYLSCEWFLRSLLQETHVSPWNETPHLADVTCSRPYLEIDAPVHVLLFGPLEPAGNFQNSFFRQTRDLLRS